MESPDSFLTIESESSVEIKIKASKFIGQAVPCTDETGAEDILNGIRRRYHDATHHCFAYRVGIGNEMKFRYSDAGEPSGTAGRPIYDQIEGKELTNLIIVVTRYYGGTKLGTGGLAHAYSESAASAIEKAGVVERHVTREISITLRFSDYNAAERSIYEFGGRIVHSDFADVVKLTIAMRLSRIEQFKEKLIETTAGRAKIDSGA